MKHSRKATMLIIIQNVTYRYTQNNSPLQELHTIACVIIVNVVMVTTCIYVSRCLIIICEVGYGYYVCDREGVWLLYGRYITGKDHESILRPNRGLYVNKQELASADQMSFTRRSLYEQMRVVIICEMGYGYYVCNREKVWLLYMGDIMSKL